MSITTGKRTEWNPMSVCNQQMNSRFAVPSEQNLLTLLLASWVASRSSDFVTTCMIRPNRTPLSSLTSLNYED